LKHLTDLQKTVHEKKVKEFEKEPSKSGNENIETDNNIEGKGIMRHYLLGKGKWVFIDWLGIWPGYGTDQGGRNLPHGFLMPYGIELVAHTPRVEVAPVLVADQPWEFAVTGGTLLADQGRFRWWYHVVLNPDDVALGYAESQDGVHWIKPLLGLKAHAGSTDTNLVALDSWGGREQGHGVFVDPSAPPAERYKMISSNETLDPLALFGAVSPDGLRWTQFPKDQLIIKNRCDTVNVGLYDEDLGKYIIYTRQRDYQGRRGINRAESADFRHFPPSEPIFESNPFDPPDWDFYTSGYNRWPGAVDAHLMRFSVYKRTQDIVDIHLAVSREGKSWHRPMGREPWIGGGSSGPSPHKCHYACTGILPTAPGEWSSYLCAHSEGHNQPGKRTPGKLLRAVSREDGFMSLSASDRGEFYTLDFPLECDSISLNVRTGFSGYVRCAILAAEGGDPSDTVMTPDHPVPVYRGFTLEDCAVIKGDHINIPLTWKGDLRRLRGKKVQLHFDMFNADLFAVKFSAI